LTAYGDISDTLCGTHPHGLCERIISLQPGNARKDTYEKVYSSQKEAFPCWFFLMAGSPRLPAAEIWLRKRQHLQGVDIEVTGNNIVDTET